MLHRTTLYAIPIVGLVLAGTGLGWWGYDQNQQRQALALQTENQNNSSFHALVDDVHRLNEEFAKSLITTDKDAFQQRLRDVWRLSFAAQTEVGRLPFDLMPMHNTQKFLSAISQQTEQWMQDRVDPKNATVHRKLEQMYTQSETVSKGLQSVQQKAFNNQVRWASVNQALTYRKGDNQVVDGFRKIDTAAAAFVEKEDHPTSLNRGKTYALSKEKDVSAQDARQAIIHFLNLPGDSKLSVQRTKQGAYRPEYHINGNVPEGSLTATVSQDGGHVLSFDVRHSKGPGAFDFAEAQSKALTWLKTKGFPKMTVIQSNQYDSVGYFVCAPVRADGSVVISQSTAVKVGLDKGNIIGMDANNYYYYPVRDVPARKFTIAQLRSKLNPAFSPQEERSVLLLDEHQHYQPAVAFYGTTGKDETFCVYMNANTGKEMNIEKLS